MPSGGPGTDDQDKSSLDEEKSFPEALRAAAAYDPGFPVTDSEGRNTVLTIDPQARNFEQVQQGDKVSIETVEAFAIQVTPNVEKPGHDSITYVHIAKPGDKPHGVAVQTKHITAIVEAIDYKARTVTMRGPEGHVRVFKVDPIVEKRFNEVKKGDEIPVKITEAIAMSVTKTQGQ